MFIINFTNIRDVGNNSQILIKYTILFTINAMESIGSQRMLLLIFTKLWLSVANLWLQLINQCSSDTMLTFLFTLMSTTNMKQHFCVWKLHLVTSDNGFHIMEEQFPRVFMLFTV